MSIADMFKWRMSNSLATLERQLFIRIGLLVPSQCQYIGHTQKISQSEGGIAKHGFRNAEILWTKVDPCQATSLRDLIDSTHKDNGGTGLVYATIKPLDGSGVSWMDISGKPDLSDIVPDAPLIGANGYIHSNITLKINNITVISTDPTF